MQRSSTAREPSTSVAPQGKSGNLGSDFSLELKNNPIDPRAALGKTLQGMIDIGIWRVKLPDLSHAQSNSSHVVCETHLLVGGGDDMGSVSDAEQLLFSIAKKLTEEQGLAHLKLKDGRTLELPPETIGVCGRVAGEDMCVEANGRFDINVVGLPEGVEQVQLQNIFIVHTYPGFLDQQYNNLHFGVSSEAIERCRIEGAEYSPARFDIEFPRD